ncbi:SRPBCC family protein [Leekyejoonella antrihumi]|uniref:Aromatic-ring-hydroxylating dioxygenase alpha subunit C-terminal domain-containing protein n=1 Tax=Leekyejoonella antrihumi TaxID=1660198 RepID=A0A563DZR4_9MICO|nr:hypothetical protein FGL98_14015 [Leekyejoonella antrihumi]
MRIPASDLEADEQDRRYYAVTVRPQVFISLVPDHVIFHRLFPIAEGRTIVECDWLCLPDVVASGKDVSSSVELFDRANRQDFDECERCQPSTSSRQYAEGGVLVPTERVVDCAVNAGACAARRRGGSPHR